jgi:D-threo-aldose 1-dehydrogenase
LKKIQLKKFNLTVSELSLGTASLLRLGNADAQINHIKSATALGFSHIDTSPYYGFGMAEEAIGRAISCNKNITVATKIGLYPPKQIFNEPNYYEILSKKIVGKINSNFSKANVDFCFKRASNSLTLSLNRLNRKEIDVLFLHEPQSELINLDEFYKWMRTEKSRVKYFGFAGEENNLKDFINSFPSDKYIYQGHINSSELVKKHLSFSYGHIKNNGVFDLKNRIKHDEKLLNTSAIIFSKHLAKLKYYSSLM